MFTFHLPEEYFFEGMPGCRSWAYYSWARANRATVLGVLEQPAGKQYVSSEVDIIMAGRRNAA